MRYNRRQVAFDVRDVRFLKCGHTGQWRSQKFSTGDALISGFPSDPHNPLLIYLINYVTKDFSEK